MRSTTAGIAVALALVLSACSGSKDVPSTAPTDSKVDKPKPLSQRDPDAYKRNVEGAMHDVPTAMQRDVQKIIVCTIRKNTANKQAKPLNAEMIRQIVEQVKADPNAAAAACQ